MIVQSDYLLLLLYCFKDKNIINRTHETTVTWEYVRTLGLLACATPESQQAVAELLPTSETTVSNPRLPSGRLELN